MTHALERAEDSSQPFTPRLTTGVYTLYGKGVGPSYGNDTLAYGARCGPVRPQRNRVRLGGRRGPGHWMVRVQWRSVRVAGRGAGGGTWLKRLKGDA